jgi:hypothetical protein
VPAKLVCFALLPLVGGCATQVYHPTKTAAEQQRDIKTCTDHGKLSAPLEPVAALNIAYECLDQKGYRRGKSRAGEP